MRGSRWMALREATGDDQALSNPIRILRSSPCSRKSEGRRHKPLNRRGHSVAEPQPTFTTETRRHGATEKNRVEKQSQKKKSKIKTREQPRTQSKFLNSSFVVAGNLDGDSDC